MSKTHRREVARKLREQIDAATDPKLIAELSHQLSKFLPRPKQRKTKTQKAEAKPKTANRFLDTTTGSMLDTLPDGERVLQHLTIEVEKREREHLTTTGQGFTKDERRTIVAELLATLSDHERAAVEGLGNADGA